MLAVCRALTSNPTLYFSFLFCIEKHVLTDTDFETGFRFSDLFCIEKHVLTVCAKTDDFETGFIFLFCFVLRKTC